MRLWFTEAPELAVTTVRLIGATGNLVPTTDPERGPGTDAPVIVAIPHALVSGRYRVEWRTMARDGHVQRGQYTFRVAAAGACAATPGLSVLRR